MRSLGDILGGFDLSTPRALASSMALREIQGLVRQRERAEAALSAGDWRTLWDICHRFENGRWRPGRESAPTPLSDRAEAHLSGGAMTVEGRSAFVSAFLAAMVDLDQAIAEADARTVER